MSRVSPVGMKSRLRHVGVADASAARGARPEDVDQAEHRLVLVARGKTSARLGRRRSTSISRVRSPARAQVAARFRAVVLLPSPALALVTSRVTIGPRRSATPSRLARRLR